MNNLEVRTSMLQNGMKQWQVADLIGISEQAFSKKLRKELPEDFKKALIDAIEKIASGETPDLSYFEQRKRKCAYEAETKKSIAEQRHINRVLDEIEERRFVGEWGF